MKGRKLIWVGICCILFFISNIQVHATGEEKKRIYFVYDNSVSMVKKPKTDIDRDWGAQAQYAVKAFCAMSNPEDEIKLYRVDNDEDDQEDDWPKDINRDNYIEAIDSIIFNGQETNYSQIRKVIEDIKKTDANAEKWVVMFTDGGVEKSINVNYTEPEFYNLLKEDLESTDINFYFVNISPVEETNKFEQDSSITPIDNIMWYRLADEENVNILQSILTVTEEIYGKRRLPDEYISIEGNDSKTLEIKFDIPVKDVVVLLQTEDGNGESNKLSFEKAIKESDWNYSITSKSKYKEDSVVKEEEQDTDGVVQGAYGVVIGFDNVTKKKGDGEYYIEMELPQGEIQRAVYYTPAVIPQVSVVPCNINENGNLLEQGKYVEGEHDIILNLIDPNTEKDVSHSSLLKGEIVEICVNDEIHTIELDGTEETNKITKTFEQGNVEIKVETEWGIKGEDKQIVAEDNLEAYDLQLSVEEDVFYYNRLQDKENAVSVSLVDGDKNVTEQINGNELKVEFLQGGKLCKNINYEQTSTSQTRKIFPYLKNNKDRDISGDLVCKVSVKLESDYYREPIIKSKEINLNMRTDELMFGIDIIEDEIDIKYWKLYIPFFRQKVPIRYAWSGGELQEKEINEINTKIQLIYSDTVEEYSLENKSTYIKRGWSNLFQYPEKITISTQASFEAFGESGTDEDEVTITLEEVSGGDVSKMIGVIIVIIIFIIIIIWNIKKYISWCVKEKCGLVLRIKADSRFEESDVWIQQRTKTKYKGIVPVIHIILLEYHFEVCVKVPIEMKEKELVLEIFSDEDTYRIQIKNGYFPEGSLWANGKEISDEPIELSKSSTELNLELKEGQSQRIKIHFGGER